MLKKLISLLTPNQREHDHNLRAEDKDYSQAHDQFAVAQRNALR